MRAMGSVILTNISTYVQIVCRLDESDLDQTRRFYETGQNTGDTGLDVVKLEASVKYKKITTKPVKSN